VRRGLHIVAALAMLCGCAALPGARADVGPERRIESMVREWFGLLVKPGAPIRLSLAEADVRSRDELRVWREKLHATHSRVEYRLGPVLVRSVGADLYRVYFELDRRAVDAAGTPHVARSGQTWLVRDAPRGLVVETIDERRLLRFPGTGPQIICY
jgi:hypothetical protein